MTEYDIAIGPVADDKVYRVVVEYEIGAIDKNIAIERFTKSDVYVCLEHHDSNFWKLSDVEIAEKFFASTKVNSFSEVFYD